MDQLQFFNTYPRVELRALRRPTCRFIRITHRLRICSRSARTAGLRVGRSRSVLLRSGVQDCAVLVRQHFSLSPISETERIVGLQSRVHGTASRHYTNHHSKPTHQLEPRPARVLVVSRARSPPEPPVHNSINSRGWQDGVLGQSAIRGYKTLLQTRPEVAWLS